LENDKKAVSWYTKAAEQGHVAAQFYLGLMYAGSQRVISDNVKAYMWFNLATFNGYSAIAVEKKEMVSKSMNNEQIRKAQELSDACLAKDYKGC
jgi:hypothetical protein